MHAGDRKKMAIRDAETERANRRLATRLAGAALGMFAFGYALVPLYDVFCELTGLGGKTGREAAVTAGGEVDRSRFVTVELVGGTEAKLPWAFRPLTGRIRLHPGELREVRFYAHNRSPGTITARAVPSVTPGPAAQFLSKLECFCFSDQRLEPGEARTLAVRFSVSPRIPRDVSTLTLAYTFFEKPADSAAGRQSPGVARAARRDG
jgi:cytochrome c oxidase assembly protein subunit 11